MASAFPLWHDAAMNAPSRPCKICGSNAPFFGAVDFNKNCEERRGLKLPPKGEEVAYYRCVDCGFLFSPLIDSWTTSSLIQRIYNADYARIDPDYEAGRHRVAATWIDDTFNHVRDKLHILDYGSGTGQLLTTLETRGYQHVDGTDLLTQAETIRPFGRYDLVTCFETLEHSPNPIQLVSDLTAYAGPQGLVMFSTLVQPDDIQEQGLDWWYAAPRNGHVSLYSTRSLDLLWAQQGFKVGHFYPHLHLAYRDFPAFAGHLWSLFEGPQS
ncbi:conserved protein of unknown function(similar to putative 3-demethylubiquinone-9 3-O-methyltransferase from Bradyrhizobium) [Magnetospira sp. QH-2]|nr:conserved protein of unknown function(similar to putative 3-demethylubiquinone-9 3-O-methyltransferase from Bradyrhizobium) [Magnetospira sp. QH-2]